MSGNTLYIFEWKEMWYGFVWRRLSYNELLFHIKIIIIIVSSLAFALTAQSRSAISFKHFSLASRKFACKAEGSRLVRSPFLKKRLPSWSGSGHKKPSHGVRGWPFKQGTCVPNFTTIELRVWPLLRLHPNNETYRRLMLIQVIASLAQ